MAFYYVLLVHKVSKIFFKRHQSHHHFESHLGLKGGNLLAVVGGWVMDRALVAHEDINEDNKDFLIDCIDF